MEAGISFSMEYLEWDAAIAAGATMDELESLPKRSPAFRAKLIAWNEAHNLIAMHQDDAARQKAKRKGGK